MRGVARLDPASIIIVGLLVGGVYLAFFYTRKFVAHRKPQTVYGPSDQGLRRPPVQQYKKVTTALEEIGIVRESQETPEHTPAGRARTPGRPGMNRLGEIYLYARFRDAVPAP